MNSSIPSICNSVIVPNKYSIEFIQPDISLYQNGNVNLFNKPLLYSPRWLILIHNVQGQSYNPNVFQHGAILRSINFLDVVDIPMKIW